MKITHYDFGKLQVAGRHYTSDVIILPDGVRDHWWREEGHSLHINDLSEVVDARPDVLVIGTGFYGRMDVPAATLAYLEDHGMQVHAMKSKDAVAEFNRLQREAARVVAALHLTC
ncbi:MAG TPA: MTH938/NDUFAF3 family protein [Gammaproteobacteria bacterium]|nr:MTH938/NDUFAF3 family protein [Gammaproteobacteria bacterium]